MTNTTNHVQTITHGHVGGTPTYYYRACSCGYEGPPRCAMSEAIDDACPKVSGASNDRGLESFAKPGGFVVPLSTGRLGERVRLTARELVHRAFKTTTSRAGVAPFCCMLDGTYPCGVLCDTLTDAIATELATLRGALEQCATIDSQTTCRQCDRLFWDCNALDDCAGGIARRALSPKEAGR